MELNDPGNSSRRNFLQKTALLAALTPKQLGRSAAESEPANLAGTGENVPEMVEADGRLRLSFGEEKVIVPKGLQPFLLVTKTGAIIVQAQLPEKPFPSPRMHYERAMGTFISRDDAKTWTNIPLKPGENGVNLEGGGIQLKDGTLIALDTYIVPGKKDGQGLGQLYTSRDDWQTLDGPVDVPFDLPGADFYASKDDGGHPHEAQRLHRRILEMPNGDLLATFYGWTKEDRTPSTYMASMMKTRVLLVRSTDKGKHWKQIATVAVGPDIGTEGLDEPVIARISKGPNAGRLLCFMRTGRELRESFSDDNGATWSPHQPRVFAGLDIYRTELWVDWLRNKTDSKGKPLDEGNSDELRGAVVDPDLIELRSGLLVAAFGIRVPQKACWKYPEHSWNGNYLAFSQDHGKTWPNVVRMTSGVMTTHYMAIEEMRTDNKVYVAYDLGAWGKSPRNAVGRTLEITINS
jgi:hypothetical protein